MTELATPHRGDIGTGAMAEAAGKAGRDPRIRRVVMLAQALLAGEVAGITAAVKDQGRMTVGTLLARLDNEGMVYVLRAQRGIGVVHSPGSGVMANRAIGNVAGVGVAVIARDRRVIGRNRMVLSLVPLAWRMANLAAGVSLVLGWIGALGIDDNIIVAIGTSQAGRVLQQDMVPTGGFPLVAIVAVERPRRIAMAGGAVRRSGCRSVVNLAGTLALPVVCGVVAAFAVGHRGNVGMARLAIDAVGACRRMVGIADTAAVTADAAGQRCHGGMAGGAVDRGGRIVCRCMVRRSDLALVAAEAVSQVADIGVALGAVA